MQIKYLAIGFSILVFSCGLLETEDENNNLDIVYIALQGLDQVGIINSQNGDLKVVDIDYDPQMKETPHFIVIDEINRYWFVTTIVSGYVGRYNMDTDELIDTLFIGDSPALMVANEIDKILYVSRMMPMGSMMTGSMSTVVQEIDYSDSSKMELSNEFSIASPAPHGIAINSTGSEVFVTSNTADWIYKITTATGEISGKVMDPSIGNYPNNVTQRLKPIQVVSIEDSLLFVACSGGIWVNPHTGESDTLSGLVQLWNSNTLTWIESFQFSWNSSPWHIIQSPVNREVYVVLSGDVLYPGSAGIACLTFESDTLALKWETSSESFETLHGIDVSSDGEQIYVSGRKDGNLHIFNGGTGKLERSISLGNNPMAGGVQVFSSP